MCYVCIAASSSLVFLFFWQLQRMACKATSDAWIRSPFRTVRQLSAQRPIFYIFSHGRDLLRLLPEPRRGEWQNRFLGKTSDESPRTPVMIRLNIVLGWAPWIDLAFFYGHGFTKYEFRQPGIAVLHYFDWTCIFTSTPSTTFSHAQHFLGTVTTRHYLRGGGGGLLVRTSILCPFFE